MRSRVLTHVAVSLAVSLSLLSASQAGEKKLQISGIYPELASYNGEGECGTGAVVPWAGKLWVITYGPHRPFGSSDKLYEISPELELIVRPESVGGTPANRMIHKETNQLFIGPYLIDAQGKVRVLSPRNVPGRFTGTARHTTEPARKMFLGTMEEGFYEVDMKTLAVRTLFVDGNILQKEKKLNYSQSNPLLPGAHGKGLYSGQGVLIFSNNGESSREALERFDVEAGVLAEYNGINWKVIRRNQFTEVTGPGGIYGNSNPETDPIWAVGWDHKSLLLGLREPRNGWRFFRLPKASNSYDGAHGWNTEWPRIRDIGSSEKPELLMTMHGMFWRFPRIFSSGNTAGIRPLSNYLKVIGDFCRWNNRVVFGCDDSAQKEFLNKRSCKGKIRGVGQSNSNLWFVPPEQLDTFGPTYASGYLYKQEIPVAGSVSEPYLFAGWPHRNAWIANHGAEEIVLTFETDIDGKEAWKKLMTIKLRGKESRVISFDETTPGEWIRVRCDVPGKLSVAWNYAPVERRGTLPDTIFAGIATTSDRKANGGLLYSRGKDFRSLALAADDRTGETLQKTGCYEFDARLNCRKSVDRNLEKFIRREVAIPRFPDSGKLCPIEMISTAIVINDDKKRRWLLPISNPETLPLQKKGILRICREVATERDLFHCGGTFYELPAENADGFAKIRPIASHPFAIQDYASWRGLLLMTGIKTGTAVDGKHLFGTAENGARLWAGVVDDLWKLGKPVGLGGPWQKTAVKADIPSDPFLFGGYDDRELIMSHEADRPVKINVEIDPTGDGIWFEYRRFVIPAGEVIRHRFPRNVQGRWIRFRTDQSCSVTTQLQYR